MRVASSPDVKIHEETKGRSDASPSQLSISKAAVQAAHNLATGASDSTQLMSDAADEPAPAGESRAKVMLPIAAVTARQVLDSDEEQELLSDGQPRTEGSSDSSGDKTAKSNRSAKKRGRKRLSVCETMPVSPSSALQIIINNPGKLESFYDVDQAKRLGKGSFGTVHKASAKSTGAIRAVKYIALERMKEKINVLKKEIEIMKAVDHPNIIMLYEIFEDPKHVLLVMELCTGGTLLNRVRMYGRLCEEQTAIAMQQILRAVYYLHSNRIAHRDLKAENVLLSSDESIRQTLLKVSDFGLSCYFKPNQIFTDKVGTFTHMSPEVLRRKYTSSCDVWACGVILYNLMSGGIPFGTEEEIKAVRIPLGKQWCDASQEVVGFLKKLLSRPAHRPPAKLALQDPFFQKHLPKPEMPTLRFGLLDDLRTFRSQNKLKRSSLTTIASMLAEEHVQAARDMFISMDTDGDGLLCVAEVEKRLRKQREQGILEKDVTRREVERIFRDFDSSLAGSSKDFTYTEFLAATFNRKACLTDAVVQEAFKILDKNNDGSIDLDELSSGRTLGHIPIEELQQILEDMDQNGDKQIDLQEFKEMLWNTDLTRANTTASLKTLTASEALALCANEGTNNAST